ncbi:MAG: hypothetical protein PHZ09_00620 [Eubacteriales bacterium]|jgi:hypothetical protein|nr:hypothetical protein [Eubacteriales bacterium]
MKKLLTLLLIMVSAFFMFSCTEGITDEEVRVILADLVPRSQQLNEIFWGSAIKTEDKDAVPLKSVTSAQYYDAASDSPYKNTGELKAAAEKVFSLDYLNSVYTVMFEGHGDIEPRFADNKQGMLMIDICYMPYEFKTEILTETAVVKERGAGLVRAEVDCITDGKPDKMYITLRLQDDIWLIDSPTY